MWGASPKPMMISGPAPLFDVTAVCWLMSSQPTKSTLIGTPVLSVNFAALARNTSSSACTNRTGRSMRKVTPFSIGSEGAATSAAFTFEVPCAAAPVAATPAAETPRANASRRVMSLFMNSSRFIAPPGVFAGALSLEHDPTALNHARQLSYRSSTSLTVGPAVHADRLPAPQRGVLQDCRVDAAYRPHPRQHE